MKKKIVFLAFFLFSSIATAKALVINGQQIDVGTIVANGSGCPAGTVIATATEDNSQVAILFSAYKAATTESSTIAVADCNLAIPVSIEAGSAVGISGATWKGSVHTAPGGFVNFHRELFFGGGQGVSSDSDWNSEGFIKFQLEDKPAVVEYGACDGTETLARVDSAATLIGANNSFSLTDGAEAQLLLMLTVRSC